MPTLRRGSIGIGLLPIPPGAACAAAEKSELAVPAFFYRLNCTAAQSCKPLTGQDLRESFLQHVPQTGDFRLPCIAGICFSIRTDIDILPDSAVHHGFEGHPQDFFNGFMLVYAFTKGRLIRLGGPAQRQEGPEADSLDSQLLAQSADALSGIPLDVSRAHDTGQRQFSRPFDPFSRLCVASAVGRGIRISPFAAPQIMRLFISIYTDHHLVESFRDPAKLRIAEFPRKVGPQDNIAAPALKPPAQSDQVRAFSVEKRFSACDDKLAELHCQSLTGKLFHIRNRHLFCPLPG